jgi:tetratricopeptide (TPR) repeat protein
MIKLATCLSIGPLLALPVLAQSPATPDGQALLGAGKAGEARAIFEALLTANPSDTEAQAGEVQASESIALQARAASQMDDALRALLRARGFAPGNGRLLYDLGILEDQMRLFHDADESLAQAEKTMPPDPKLLYAIARVKMDLGQLTPDEDKMLAYLAARPDDASAHFGLGRIYQIGLKFDKAKGEFARSIELKPVQTEAYYELGDIALKQGDLGQALEQFNKTLARNPQHGGALEGAGEAEFKLKKYDEAKAFLLRAVTAAPDYPPCHYYLGLTLARLGQKEESQKELETASKMSEQQNSTGPMRIQQQATPQ